MHEKICDENSSTREKSSEYQRERLRAGTLQYHIQKRSGKNTKDKMEEGKRGRAVGHFCLEGRVD